MNLDELKEWLRIDGSDEDITLNSLLSASTLLIKQSTGVQLADLQDNPEGQELYKLIQKIIVAELYENREGATKANKLLISLTAQLEALKLV